MTGFEKLYLAMVLVAFGSFMATLAMQQLRNVTK